VAAGTVHPTIGRRYRLSEAAQAHEDLAARRIVGKLLLLPDAAG
jgi:NADPH2:quinone reductase